MRGGSFLINASSIILISDKRINRCTFIIFERISRRLRRNNSIICNRLRGLYRLNRLNFMIGQSLGRRSLFLSFHIILLQFLTYTLYLMVSLSNLCFFWYFLLFDLHIFCIIWNLKILLMWENLRLRYWW